MSDRITIYQKPACSKCMATLAILVESGAEFESINYYETPFTVEKMQELVCKLNMPLRDILRKNEPMAAGLESVPDDELIKIMVNNPDLIQRPIVVRGDKAKLCRPPENAMELLQVDT